MRTQKPLFTLLLMIGLVFLLSQCATLPTRIPADNAFRSWPERQRQLQQVTAWQIRGAVAANDGQDGGSARLFWKQQNGRFVVRLLGPLGGGQVVIRGSLQQVQARTRAGQILKARTPDILVQQVTGWQIPIAHLHYWIRGLPVPGISKAIRWDAFHHPTSLKQAGWQIHFQRYTAKAGMDLPSKLTLRAGPLTVRIVISEWQIG